MIGRHAASILLLPLLLAGCTRAPFEQGRFATGFQALTNWDPEADGSYRIELDYTDALDSGFTAPSRRQTDDGYFTFRFLLRDTTGRSQRFRYKLYYRNETYKFPEAAANGKQHEFAHENFYGSWEQASEGFRLSPAANAEGIEVVDRFRIQGNPRDEELYERDGHNARWARNPRVGDYAFLLVVMPEEHYRIAQPPDGVEHIGHPDERGAFIEPFWYYLHGPGAHDPQVQAMLAPGRLHVVARPDLGRGIYVNLPTGQAGVSDSMRTDAFNDICGNDPSLTKQAPFEQFIHYVHESTRFENIPVIADVLGNEYTPADHDRYRCFFPADQMVSLRPMTTKAPCSTVYSDPERHVIELHNPASQDGDWRKENVGIRSRHGLAYGKYRVRCKLTRLLNDSDMWVGLTNAIWLIYDGAPGNLRRPCTVDGYMANYYGGDNDERVARVAYSEIDFEILKTPPYCPDAGFPPVYAQAVADPNDRQAWQRFMPGEPRDDRGMITVACTNWDMACHSPPAFDVGCHTIEKDGQVFFNHRWDHNYRALTQKSEAPDKELFGGDHYWFEIDWRPEEIFWRIGPDADHMRLVAYMNSSVTEISNVQMLLIVTQEFHNTRWWPGSPFEQGFVPFPAKDYVGEVQEVVIE